MSFFFESLHKLKCPNFSLTIGWLSGQKFSIGSIILTQHLKDIAYYLLPYFHFWEIQYGWFFLCSSPVVSLYHWYFSILMLCLPVDFFLNSCFFSDVPFYMMSYSCFIWTICNIYSSSLSILFKVLEQFYASRIVLSFTDLLSFFSPVQ